ncbi:MAG: diacylglycerol/lipid kinase family protein [Terriglobia bacterium]
MKVLLLANQEAAGGRAVRLLPRLRDFFCAHFPGLEYSHPANAGKIHWLAAEAAAAGFERVLVAGGDGTAHAVVNALRGTETALGVLPLGHGNDLARALGIPLEPMAAAEFLLRAPVTAIDLVRAGEESYACVASVGLDAETNRRANAWGSWPRGHARYLLAGLRTLLSYRPLRVELVTDSEEFSGEVMWVAVANAPYYGGGLRIAPEAALDDGIMDICVIERMSRTQMLALYPRLRTGAHLRASHVRYFRACRVELRAPPGAALFGDGELIGRLPAELHVEPAAVRVLGRPD